MKSTFSNVLLVIALITGISFNVHAQRIQKGAGSDEMKNLKEGTTYVQKTEDADFNKKLEEAMKAHWTINKFEMIELGSVESHLGNDKNYILTTLSGSTIGTVGGGFVKLALFCGDKKKLKSYTTLDFIIWIPIVAVEQKDFGDCAEYTINSMNAALNLMVTKNLEGREKKVQELTDRETNAGAKKLKGKTLLIDESWVDAKRTGNCIDKKGIAAYTMKHKEMARQDISDLLKKRDGKYCQLYYNIFAVGSTYRKEIYIIDFETQQILFAKVLGCASAWSGMGPKDFKAIEDAINGKVDGD
jgi:hypothetical protein